MMATEATADTIATTSEFPNHELVGLAVVLAVARHIN